MEITFDRIEEGTAVLTAENGQLFTLPAHALPSGSTPGDVFTAEWENGLPVRLTPRPEIRAARSQRIRQKLEKLKNKKEKDLTS